MIWIEITKAIHQLPVGHIQQMCDRKANAIIASGHAKKAKSPKIEESPKRGRPPKVEVASIEPKKEAKVETAEVSPVVEKKKVKEDKKESTQGEV